MYRNTQNSTEMSDWSPHFGYNHNPPYHAYAYGLMCPTGPEQAHRNLTGWGEAGGNDLSSSSSSNNNHGNAGMTQAYYANMAPRTQGESPPDSPEQRGPCRYQGPDVVYLGDTQAGCLVLTGAQQAPEDTGANEARRENEARRVGSDSISDSESRVSPDSWSSCSSREISLPQTDPATWAKNGLNGEASNGSPDPSEAVSTVGEPKAKEVTGKEGTNSEPGPEPEPKPEAEPEAAFDRSSAAFPKAKVRAAFSESQMNVLVQRFSVQRYLPPAEMKNLAEMTGLTYKQVKTWFQNRRMKLRRHQKDTSWVSERYATNKGGPVCGPVFNMPPHGPPYQGDARPQLKDHYNQHMMGAALKKTAPQNLAFYLAAMGSAAGAAGYPTWPPGPSQNAMPNRPHPSGWSMSPGIGHFEYNPCAVNPAGVSANSPGYDNGYEFKDGEPGNGRSSLNSAVVHSMSQ